MEKGMTYNYHTHTYRCRHAAGAEEDYVVKSIECGIKYMGFSEHIPFVFPDGYESPFRVPSCEGRDYVSTIAALREKYKQEIDIKVGFEMEYYPSYFNQMLQKAVEYGGEYLILGQHFLHEEYPGGIKTNKENYSTDDLKEYVSCIVSGIQSGVYTYIAHPDVLKFKGDIELYRNEMRKICVASRICNVPLEINFLGINTNRNYPNEIFWEIAGEENAPVTFGFDAHNTDSHFAESAFMKAMNIVEKYKLNYIGRPDIILIQDGLKQS